MDVLIPTGKTAPNTAEFGLWQPCGCGCPVCSSFVFICELLCDPAAGKAFLGVNNRAHWGLLHEFIFPFETVDRMVTCYERCWNSEYLDEVWHPMGPHWSAKKRMHITVYHACLLLCAMNDCIWFLNWLIHVLLFPCTWCALESTCCGPSLWRSEESFRIHFSPSTFRWLLRFLSHL